MRDGIKSNAWNWKNCTMYVQDFKSPGINITAEISKEEANNFIQMCNIFVTSNSHEQSIDEYIMKFDESTFSLNGSPSVRTDVNEVIESSRNTVQNLEHPENSNSSSSSNDRSRASSTNTTLNPISTLKLVNMIEVKNVSRAIPTIAVDLVYRMAQRYFDEIEIEALLTCYLKEFEPTLRVKSFGSVTYGFAGSRTNFNILVNAGNKNGWNIPNFICKNTANLSVLGLAMQKPFEIFQSFERFFSAAQSDFIVLSSIKGDRV